MKIETFYPVDKRLRTCIEYYYFLKSESNDFNADYHVFPNTLQALNIHKNIKCEIASQSVKVTGIAENNFELLLQGRREKPLYIQLKGKINKITIIFKPLGLNHFIKLAFNKIASKHTQNFAEWNYHEKHSQFLSEFFFESDFSKRIEILENYLLLHYHSINGMELLNQSLDLLCDFSHELSIKEIAGKINLTTRTFDRLFKLNMGISPIKYRKIARFRHSLKSKIVNQQFKKLTAIGYESNFYDQSYFVKIYRELTNNTPRKFFDSVDKFADNQLILKFTSQ